MNLLLHANISYHESAESSTEIPLSLPYMILDEEDITILQVWKVLLKAINEDCEVRQAAVRLDYKDRQLLALSK